MRSLGAIQHTYVVAHEWGGMRETRERSRRAESFRCVEKCGYILRTYAVSGLPLGYIRGGTRVVRSALCEKGIALSWWPEGSVLIVFIRARPTRVFKPAEALTRRRMGSWRGRGAVAAACSEGEQALANGWRCAGRCAWPGREAGRRGALCEPVCRLRGQGFVYRDRPRAGRPGLSGCGMRRASGGQTIFTVRAVFFTLYTSS